MSTGRDLQLEKNAYNDDKNSAYQDFASPETFTALFKLATAADVNQKISDCIRLGFTVYPDKNIANAMLNISDLLSRKAYADRSEVLERIRILHDRVVADLAGNEILPADAKNLLHAALTLAKVFRDKAHHEKKLISAVQDTFSRLPWAAANVATTPSTIFCSSQNKNRTNNPKETKHHHRCRSA